MVSDYLPWLVSREMQLQGLVCPDSLLGRVEALRRRPEEVTDADLGRFIDLAALTRAPRTQVIDTALHALRAIYAADLSYVRIGRWLARRDDAPLFVIYLRGLDMVSHELWRVAFTP